jgi:hypothetical protein
MSWRVNLALRVPLREDVPAWVTDYLLSLGKPPEAAAADGRVVAAGVPDDVDAWWTFALPEPGFLAVPWSDVVLLDDEWGHLTVATVHASIHDDAYGEAFCLAGVLAAHAVDGPIGAMWTDFDGSPDALSSYDGDLVVAEPAQPPRVLEHDRPEVRAFGRTDSPTVPVLEAHGASPAVAHGLLGAPREEPSTARYLLARTLRRAVEQGWDGGPREVLTAVLDVLDAGSDPVAGARLPGWEVTETAFPSVDADRRRRTARTVDRLTDLVEALDDCDLSAGPDRP